MFKANSTLFGRRFLASVREPALSTSLPSLWTSFASHRAAQLANFVQTPPPRRTIHSERPFSQSAKASRHTTKRSFTGPGLLLIGFTTHASQPAPGPCTSVAESAATAAPSAKLDIRRLARLAWQRSIHTDARGGRGGAVVESRRHMASKSGGGDNEGKPAAPNPKPDVSKPPPESGQPAAPHHEHHESMVETMSKYLHMPKMPHRPTREELMAAANGFWQRMKVRLKWASIRSMRPWNIDEWGAFVSWFLFGHLVWVLVGTTTFFSLLILSINTVFAQGRPIAHVTEILTTDWTHRNPCQMGWRLPHPVCRRVSSLRVCHRS